jgi:hypothetical protein
VEALITGSHLISVLSIILTLLTSPRNAAMTILSVLFPNPLPFCSVAWVYSAWVFSCGANIQPKLNRRRQRGIKPCRFRIALKVIRVIRVICEICGLKTKAVQGLSPGRLFLLSKGHVTPALASDLLGQVQDRQILWLYQSIDE